MKLTNTYTPNHIKISKSNRIQRSNSKNPVPLSSKINRPSKRNTIPNHGIKNIHHSLKPTPHVKKRRNRRVTIQEDISSIMNIKSITTNLPNLMTPKPNTPDPARAASAARDQTNQASESCRYEGLLSLEDSWMKISVVIEEVGLINCERGVVDQRARLLIRGSAHGG